MSKGPAIACDELQADECDRVYPDEDAFPVRHGTEAIGLTALMKRIAHRAS